ncbi:GAF and ANTAR domain-containing protein [Streptacidiphilus neutrinimicus]|uniref:GAF and ANTAR domain-containing protein n=1 Tax=Streptacidiphilus neutrinimicus TaxID=105420 RepID=UPI0005A9B356|nr:GAF and ANTAR domain-containing protein [Streptacidiphilus neutrinimicus]
MDLTRVVQIMGNAIAEEDADALPGRLCLALDEVLEGDGTVLVLMAHLSHHRVLAASDKHTARLGELEFSLGEGPGLDAVARSAAVLAGDLTGGDGDRWPALAVTLAGSGLPVRAVFAFPLQLSGVSFGVLEVSRHRPGELDERESANGRIAADLASVALARSFEAAGQPLGAPTWPEESGVDGVEVDQAVGMVMAQLRAPADVALSTLRARAFAEGRTVGELALDVLGRRVSFKP